MFCTKCGKELYNGDRFCAFCGAEVRRPQASKDDEVVFNPPFKLEAQKKTEEILKAAEEVKQKETAQTKRETVSFDWNLDGFPTERPKKTEDAVFNWDSVLEKRTGRKVDEDESFFVERIKPTAHETASPITAEIEKELRDMSRSEKAEAPKWIKLNDNERADRTYEHEESSVPQEEKQAEKQQEEPKEDILSAEELEKELFGIFEEKSDECKEPTTADTAKDIEENNSVIPNKSSVFGTPSKDSRFYTFNQKSDEFEELLNKERERIRSMEDEYNRRLENMDYTWVPEVFKSRTAQRNAGVTAGNTELKTVKTAETQGKDEAAVLVEVIQPQTPNTVDLTREYHHINIPETKPSPVPESVKPEEVKDEEEKITAAAAVAAKEESKRKETKTEEAKTETVEKDKLRYSDIFPRIGAETAGSLGTGELPEKAGDSQKSNEDGDKKDGGHSGTAIAAVFDDEDEEPVKKHTLLKVLIVILLIALVIEGAALAVRFFAPESKAAKMIDDAVFAVADIFVSGDSQDDGGDAELDLDFDAEDSKAAYISNIVTEKAAKVNSIGAVKYNSDLTYESGKKYSFAEISEAEAFVDAEWADAGATYGEKLLEGVIKYYDGWIDTNQDEDLVGINTLEIGEIRTGENGFYVLCKATYATADGGELSQAQTVFVKISNGLMVINEIKEETF